jgi:hypothetical protein
LRFLSGDQGQFEEAPIIETARAFGIWRPAHGIGLARVTLFFAVLVRLDHVASFILNADDGFI